MNFLQLCQKVRQECGIQGQGPTSVTSQTGLLKRIVDWVSEADLHIQSLHADWNFLWAEFTADTVLGSAEITKPNDYGQWNIDSFAVDVGTVDGRKLSYQPFEEWQLNKYLKTNQEPSSVTVIPNQNLRLDNPADGVYEIYAEYWKAPTQLTDNSDVPPYPTRFHEAIVELAKSYFYADQEAWDNFKEATQKYEKWLNKLEAHSLPGQQMRSQAQSPENFNVRPI